MPRLDQRLGFTRYEADDYYRRALDAYRKRNLDDAIELMDAAIDTLPNNAEYLAARGYFYFEDGEEDKARADFEAALKRFKYEMLAHYGLGMIATRDKNWTGARAHFNAARLADPERIETAYALAVTLYHLREYPAALELMTPAAAQFEATNHEQKNDARKWLREITRAVTNAAGGRAALKTPALPPGGQG